ncbi:MAG: CDP-glycerol glycerophosphotransferase family protein [Verrucomicrobia bacterium]|nr:CDP-glycerol glycerophosphotransferase family protein [Verrucomicrobiota bacterium]
MTAGLLLGPLEHYLDHIAPLCALRGMPLLVTDHEVERLSIAFYPDIETRCLTPDQIVSAFDTLYVCTPRLLFEQDFFIPQKLLGKTLKTIWVPHGNSDKGYASHHMEALKDEKATLVYGDRMIDFLKLKDVFSHLKVEHVGNYRYAYWEKHRAFYASLLPSLPGRKVLYAPTWNDAEKSSSYFDLLPHLTYHPDFSIILRPHPNLPLPEEPLPPNIYLCTHFPPVYPWIDLCDIYLGDMSSIGYDFLKTQKPMFFLNQNRRTHLPLFRCGTVINPSDYPRIYDILSAADNQPFYSIQRETYEHTFTCKAL